MSRPQYGTHTPAATQPPPDTTQQSPARAPATQRFSLKAIWSLVLPTQARAGYRTARVIRAPGNGAAGNRALWGRPARSDTYGTGTRPRSRARPWPRR